jgi:hypothetical protein
VEKVKAETTGLARIMNISSLQKRSLIHISTGDSVFYGEELKDLLDLFNL